MGSTSNHERPSPEDPNSTQRKTELLRRRIEAAVKGVAADLGLPWELLTLRERARQYFSRPDVLDAWMEHDRSRGLQFPHQAYVFRELLRCGKEIRKERKELSRRGKETTPSSPSEEIVREVYETYSRDEWKNLVTKLERASKTSIRNTQPADRQGSYTFDTWSATP